MKISPIYQEAIEIAKTNGFEYTRYWVQSGIGQTPVHKSAKFAQFFFKTDEHARAYQMTMNPQKHLRKYIDTHYKVEHEKSLTN